MDATPLLNKIAKAFADCRLEAVMVGNAAAALHGAPVTTLDIDFMFHKTPVTLRKLKSVADSLDAVIFKPYYPVSDLYRLGDITAGLQLDFMSRLHGVRSYASLRSRAQRIEFGTSSIYVASLSDVIKSKKAANREQDRAVIGLLEKVLHEQEEAKTTTREREEEPR